MRSKDSNWVPGGSRARRFGRTCTIIVIATFFGDEPLPHDRIPESPGCHTLHGIVLHVLCNCSTLYGESRRLEHDSFARHSSVLAVECNTRPIVGVSWMIELPEISMVRFCIRAYTSTRFWVQPPDAGTRRRLQSRSPALAIEGVYIELRHRKFRTSMRPNSR
jgi:hypothetical protein